MTYLKSIIKLKVNIYMIVFRLNYVSRVDVYTVRTVIYVIVIIENFSFLIILWTVMIE